MLVVEEVTKVSKKNHNFSGPGTLKLKRFPLYSYLMLQVDSCSTVFGVLTRYIFIGLDIDEGASGPQTFHSSQCDSEQQKTRSLFFCDTIFSILIREKFPGLQTDCLSSAQIKLHDPEHLIISHATQRSRRQPTANDTFLIGPL